MQNSGSSVARLVITVLAVVCIVLAVVFALKNKPDCSGKTSEPEPTEYSSYQDQDYSVSGGDITFDDNNTEEMDTIPNEAPNEADGAQPAASSTDS